MTPANPMAIAVQRRMPTFSPSTGMASMLVMKGAAKPMATASARGMWRMAMKKLQVTENKQDRAGHLQIEAVGAQSREQQPRRDEERQQDHGKHVPSPGDLQGRQGLRHDLRQ